jgi:hypothetical protein
MALKQPKTTDEWYKFMAAYNPTWTPAKVDSSIKNYGQQQLLDTYQDVVRTVDGVFNKGIGKELGLLMNSNNQKTATDEWRASNTAEWVKRNSANAEQSLSSNKDYFEKLATAGFLDSETLDKFNSLVSSVKQYIPTLSVQPSTYGSAKVDNAGLNSSLVNNVAGKEPVATVGAPLLPAPQQKVNNGSTPVPPSNNPAVDVSKFAKLNDQQLFMAIYKGEIKPSKDDPAWTALYQNGQPTPAQTEAYTKWANFLKTNPFPVKNDAPQATQTVNPMDEISRIDEEANKMQSEDLSKLLNSNKKVDLSGSAALVEKLLGSMENKGGQPVQSLEQIMADQRAALGVGELETSLNTVDSQIAKLDADYKSLMPEEENRLVSVGQIRRRQSTLDLQYQRQKNDLLAEKNSITNELNMKYGVINSMVSLAGQDIKNASDAYNTQFNQAVSMINLVKGIEQDAKTEEERKTDNARANIQIMSNLLQSGNISYGDLPMSSLIDIKNMEIQAGLPVGFTSYVRETVKDPIVSTLTAYNDPSGHRIQPIMTKNADGSVQIQNIDIGLVENANKSGTSGVGVGGGGSKGTPEQALTLTPGGLGGQCGRFVNNYSKLRMGDTYQEKMNEMDSSIKKPEAGMVFVMPYKDTGHTGFIQSISEDGKTATVVDSNWGLDEKIQIHDIPISKMTGFQRVWSDEESQAQTASQAQTIEIPSTGLGWFDELFGGSITIPAETAPSVSAPSSSGSSSGGFVPVY